MIPPTPYRPQDDSAEINARERALLSAIAARDDAALKELYRLYHRRLARFLMRITTNYELAEEIINDTFWVVWRHAGEFRGSSRVSTWIFGIAYRRGLKALKRAAPLPFDPMLEIAESDEPFGRVELTEWLDAALARLPVEQHVVIELAYQLGHSCEEIAVIMECPVNTVKTRMFHARRKLRGLLTALAGANPIGEHSERA